MTEITMLPSFQQAVTHSVDKLAKALAAVQAELPRVTKDALADIKGKEGKPGFKYAYADLADVSQQILPLLGRNGLAFMCKPTLIDGHMYLAYSLLHESGQREDGVYPLPNGVTPQTLGSAITYGRRYCLCAVTGIAADEDDDGQAASQKPAESKPERAPAQRRQSQDWNRYNDAKRTQETVELPPAPDDKPKHKSPAQEFAETAERIVEINGTVDELRKNVYEIAAPAGCLPNRVMTKWHEDEMPLSWVLTEARKRIEKEQHPASKA